MSFDFCIKLLSCKSLASAANSSWNLQRSLRMKHGVVQLGNQHPRPKTRMNNTHISWHREPSVFEITLDFSGSQTDRKGTTSHFSILFYQNLSIPKLPWLLQLSLELGLESTLWDLIRALDRSGHSNRCQTRCQQECRKIWEIERQNVWQILWECCCMVAISQRKILTWKCLEESCHGLCPCHRRSGGPNTNFSCSKVSVSEALVMVCMAKPWVDHDFPSSIWTGKTSWRCQHLWFEPCGPSLSSFLMFSACLWCWLSMQFFASENFPGPGEGGEERWWATQGAQQLGVAVMTVEVEVEFFCHSHNILHPMVWEESGVLHWQAYLFAVWWYTWHWPTIFGTLQILSNVTCSFPPGQPLVLHRHNKINRRTVGLCLPK